MTQKLFLLDAMALIYRAYYAMVKSPRLTSKGVNTSAILGFTNTLHEVLTTEKPSHIAVSFDTGAPTLRHADFEKYKAHRESTPDDIVTAIPYIKQILEAFNIPVFVLDGYEADDIIGTIAKKAETEGFQVYMMTSDKDYGQLVSENIFMYKPGKFGQKAEVVGVADICRKYEIEKPEQLIDILGLWGDSSDNIPGVPSIGEIKAKKLIAQFGSIENIYKNIDQVENDKLRQTLLDHKDQALMSKMLATIILDVPVDIDFKTMRYQGPNEQQLKKLFNELEFKALARRIFDSPTAKSESKTTSTTPGPDLFSIPDSEKKEIEEEIIEEKFKCFNDTCHRFEEIKTWQDAKLLLSTPDTLYFDWILWNSKISGFAFSTNRGTIYYHFLENKERHYKSLLEAIFQSERTIVTYQCKECFKFFKSLRIEPQASFFDIEIAHYLIQPENSHRLDRLAESFLSYTPLHSPTEKDEPFSSNNEASSLQFADHLINSTCERIEIFEKLHPLFRGELENSQLYNLFLQMEMPLAEVLANMEYTGVRIDTAVLQKNAETLDDDLHKLEREIFELAGTTFNLASPKQLGEVLFEKLQIIENAKLTKTKQYQTGEEILTKLINKHPIVALILEWRSLAKLKSTYIDALPLLVNPKTGRIHTTFNQTVTSTGRLSSTNPNLQNIPIRTERGRDIRKAFVASDKDAVILSADYSQIELRIVASICGDERMINAFKNNEDIHASMAAHVYNVPISEVTSLMRRNAKTVNFGILYGISAFGLADRLHIPQREARELIENYFFNFPKIQEYLDQTTLFAREHGYVETLLGRRRYIRDIDSHNAVLRKSAERNAINAPIQGTAADLIKIAMNHIFKAMKRERLESRMILQVHDELVFEVPQKELDTMKTLVSSMMEGAMQLAVPLAIEMNEGKSWYEAH